MRGTGGRSGPVSLILLRAPKGFFLRMNKTRKENVTVSQPSIRGENATTLSPKEIGRKCFSEWLEFFAGVDNFKSFKN